MEKNGKNGKGWKRMEKGKQIDWFDVVAIGLVCCFLLQIFHQFC